MLAAGTAAVFVVASVVVCLTSVLLFSCFVSSLLHLHSSLIEPICQKLWIAPFESVIRIIEARTHTHAHSWDSNKKEEEEIKRATTSVIGFPLRTHYTETHSTEQSTDMRRESTWTYERDKGWEHVRAHKIGWSVRERANKSYRQQLYARMRVPYSSAKSEIDTEIGYCAVLHIWYTPNGCRYIFRHSNDENGAASVGVCVCVCTHVSVWNESLRPFSVPQR